MAAHSVFLSKLTTKKNSYFFLFFLCVVVVALNLVSSQSFPSVMYGLMHADENAQLDYLKKIWGSQLYVHELNALKDDNKMRLLYKIEQEDAERKKIITSLEKITEEYPYAPEPYYNLSQLYQSMGETALANKYLRKAQQIDPSLK